MASSNAPGPSVAPPALSPPVAVSSWSRQTTAARSVFTNPALDRLAEGLMHRGAQPKSFALSMPSVPPLPSVQYVLAPGSYRMSQGTPPRATGGTLPSVARGLTSVWNAATPLPPMPTATAMATLARTTPAVASQPGAPASEEDLGPALEASRVRPSTLANVFASLGVACTETFIFAPLDYISTLQRLLKAPLSMRDVGKRTYARYGLRGFWLGYPSEASNTTLRRGNQAVTFPLLREKLAAVFGVPITDPWVHICSAFLTSLVDPVLTTPGNRLRIIRVSPDFRDQVHSMWDAARIVYASEGWRGYYKGLGLSLKRSALFVTTWQSLVRAGQTLLPKDRRPAELRRENFLISVGAGIGAAVVTSPIDVVLSRLMEALKQAGATTVLSARALSLQMWRDGGIRIFFRGSALKIWCVGPRTGFSAVAIEIIAEFMHAKGEDKKA